MNSFSLSKCFTVVLFLVFGQLGLAEMDGRGMQAIIDCANDACKADSTSETCKARKAECRTLQEEIRAAELAKETKVSCKAAMKEWRDKAAKGTRACNAFDKSLGKSCQERIKSCENKITGAVDGSGGETLGFIQQIVQQSLSSKSGAIAEDVVNGGAPCVKQFDGKAKRDAEKEFTKDRRDLEDKIKKEVDKQTELNQELREKKDKISTKISDLDAENKKEALKRETKMREETTRLSKSTVDIGKRLRAYDTAILQENQKLTKIRFANQTALLELTSDKILNRCKQQLLTLKNGILNPASADPKDAGQLKALQGQMGQGATGTANLTALLKQTKDACFTQENTKKQQLQIQYNEDQVNANKRIEEIQASIADEKKQLKLDQDSLASVKAENEKEGTTAETEKLTKIQNLNTELTNFQDSINEKLVNSKTQAQKLTTEIANMTIKKDFDVEPAFDDASDAIENAENSRVSALEDCGCKEGTNKDNSECTMLNSKALDNDGSGSGTSKTKTKN